MCNESDQGTVFEDWSASIPESPVGRISTGDSETDVVVGDREGNERLLVFRDAGIVVSGDEIGTVQFAVSPEHVLLLKEEILISDVQVH